MNAPSAAGDRRVPASWLVTLVEPLIDLATRAALEDEMSARCGRDPVWAQWWFAGVISDHVLTLPAADPWRHLSAHVASAVGGMTRGSSPAPPRRTGAVGEFGAFGTVRDGADLMPELPPEVSTDASMAALGPGLSAPGAAVLAFSADGYEAGARAIAALHGPGGDLEEAGGARMFVVLSTALRWAMWRRRVYTPGEDPLTLASGFAWLWRAEVLRAGGQLPASELDSIEVLRRDCDLGHIDYEQMRFDPEESW